MLNCLVKKLFGLLFMVICYFPVDLGYKPPKKSGNTGLRTRDVLVKFELGVLCSVLKIQLF